MKAIVELLAGAPPQARPLPSALDPPWRTIYQRASPVHDRAEAELMIWKATRGLPDRRQLASDLVDLLPGDDAFNPFPSLHDMVGQFPPVDWLWPSWIPRSMLTLFGAAPGAGKSLVALDLARRIIGGLPFPDGAPVPCPGSHVLIVDAEGAPALLNQRAQAWEIDRRRLFLMLAPDSHGLINLADQRQQLLLLNMCRHIRPALVIVDSLAAATARAETSLEGARTILGLLAALARQARVAVLVIHHLRKRATSFPSLSAPHIVAADLRGSSHLSAAARSVLALSVPDAVPPFPASPPAELAPGDVDPSSAAPHPAAGPLRRLEVVKTNLCRPPPPLGVILEGQDVPVPTLRYTQILEPAPPPTQVELCARWLLQFLAGAGEPVKPAAVVQAAGEMGFSRPTLYRARQILARSIVDEGNSRRDPHKRWALATPEGTPRQ